MGEVIATFFTYFSMYVGACVILALIVQVIWKYILKGDQ